MTDDQPVDPATIIQDALTQDSHGGFVTGWILMAKTLNHDGDESWCYYTSAEQRLIESRGLVETLLDILKYEQWRDLTEREETD